MFLALQTVTPRSQGRVVVGQPPAIRRRCHVLNDPSARPCQLPPPRPRRPAAPVVLSARPRELLVPLAVSTHPGSTPRFRRQRSREGDSATVRRQWQLSRLGPVDSATSPAKSPRSNARSACVRSAKIIPISTAAIPIARTRSIVPASAIAHRDANGQIAIPYWEAVGPWDVDNDNDGVPDSVWVDLGDPVTQAEDGTLYKPLYAFLVMDMDSRLNVNAHGNSWSDLIRWQSEQTKPAAG